MKKHLKEDVNYILVSMGNVREKEVKEYHTLSDALLKAIHSMYEDEHMTHNGLEKDKSYLTTILENVIEEEKQLGSLKSKILKDDDYKSYHKYLLAYDKLQQSIQSLKKLKNFVEFNMNTRIKEDNKAIQEISNIK